MDERYDILGLGCVAIDDLLYVDAYPAADTKVQVQRRERQCGGLTGTALVAAARMGAKCVYAGTLGDDELSQLVLHRLSAEGVDVSHAKRVPGARPIHSVVIVDQSRRTRTIFFDLHNVLGAQVDWPEESLIRTARVLYVDHFGMEGMIRAARIARSARIPVVADFESGDRPEFAELCGLVDHLILSHEFAATLTASGSSEAAKKLWTDDRAAVIITCGADGAWYVSEANPRSSERYPAFPVTPVDTTGCGDVFHGVYAWALARGFDMRERLRYAAAAAALKATQRGGQAGIPDRAAVEAYLKGEQS